MSLSGIPLVYYQDLGLSKEIRHNIKAYMKLCLVLLGFLLLYIL